MSGRTRVLILGAGGFVGVHLREAFAERMSDTADVVATSLNGSRDGIRALDILDCHAIASALSDLKPSHVINLAGIAAPVTARRNRSLAWRLHCQAAETLGFMILQHVPDAWLLHVGSGLAYGQTAVGRKCLSEADPLAPTDPYTASKAAGDLAIGALAFDGLKCLRLRPFNHVGRGQSRDFVVSSFASQLADMMSGSAPPVIRVGNLDAARDFLDVRDVADAYVTLVERSEDLAQGAIYNIASGTTWTISAVLDELIALSGLDVSIEIDPERQRPSDIPRICGSSKRLTADTEWRPRHNFKTTLSDTLNSFRSLQ